MLACGHGHAALGGGPIAKASRKDQYEWLHLIADRMAPNMRRAFMAAASSLQGSVSLRALAAAMESRRPDEVLQLLALEGAFTAALANNLGGAITDTFTAAGRGAIQATLPRAAQLRARFDLTNPASIEFLRTYNFGLIRELVQETRRAIGDVVLDAFRQGGHPYEQARKIKPLIGLTASQGRAVMNYRAAQSLVQRDQVKLDAAVDRYAAKLLKMRSETIARTETIRAANAGQQQLWKQATEQGLLDPITTRRGWVLARDDRLCPICRAIPAMNPQGRGLNEPFSTPKGPVMYAPAHPRCRCTAALVGF